MSTMSVISVSSASSSSCPPATPYGSQNSLPYTPPSSAPTLSPEIASYSASLTKTMNLGYMNAMRDLRDDRKTKHRRNVTEVQFEDVNPFDVQAWSQKVPGRNVRQSHPPPRIPLPPLPHAASSPTDVRERPSIYTISPPPAQRPASFGEPSPSHGRERSAEHHFHRLRVEEQMDVEEMQDDDVAEPPLVRPRLLDFRSSSKWSALSSMDSSGQNSPGSMMSEDSFCAPDPMEALGFPSGPRPTAGMQRIPSGLTRMSIASDATAETDITITQSIYENADEGAHLGLKSGPRPVRPRPYVVPSRGRDLSGESIHAEQEDGRTLSENMLYTVGVRSQRARNVRPPR